MNGLAKLVIFSSPILGFVLFFLISSQRSMDVKIEKNDAEFSRSWSEQEADMAKDPAAKKRYQERAEKAELEIEELKKKEIERQKKDEQFEEAMEKALQESEKELEKKLK